MCKRYKRKKRLSARTQKIKSQLYSTMPNMRHHQPNRHAVPHTHPHSEKQARIGMTTRGRRSRLSTFSLLFLLGRGRGGGGGTEPWHLDNFQPKIGRVALLMTRPRNVHSLCVEKTCFGWEPHVQMSPKLLPTCTLNCSSREVTLLPLEPDLPRLIQTPLTTPDSIRNLAKNV